jgi:uncharacterized membrane protein
MNWDIVLNVAIFAGVVGSAAIFIVSQQRRENHAETAELAGTRGEKIDDLQDDIRKLRESNKAEMKEMRDHQLKQDGKIELLMSQKFNEMAASVAGQVMEKLEELKESA